MRLGTDVPKPYVVFDGTFSSPRLDHPECVAVGSGGVLWCGGEAGQIYRVEGQSIEQVATTGGFTLGMAFDGNRSLFVCDLAARCLWKCDTESGSLEVFADSCAGKPLVAPNFPLILPDGTLLLTDSGGAHQPSPGLLHFEPDGVGEVWCDQLLDFANGLALSEDASVVYIVESWAHRILAVDLDERFKPRGPIRTYADVPGYIPDGLAVGPDGTLYVGCYEPSAILRIPEAGCVEVFAHDESAHILCHPTNLAFRGAELVVSNLGRWHLTGFDLRD